MCIIFVDILRPLKCWPPIHSVFELNELLPRPKPVPVPSPDLAPALGDDPPAVICAQQAVEVDKVAHMMATREIGC